MSPLALASRPHYSHSWTGPECPVGARDPVPLSGGASPASAASALVQPLWPVRACSSAFTLFILFPLRSRSTGSEIS